MSAFQPPNKCIFTVNCFFIKKNFCEKEIVQVRKTFNRFITLPGLLIVSKSWSTIIQRSLLYLCTLYFQHTRGWGTLHNGHSFHQLQGQRETPPAWTWGAQSGGLCSSLYDAAATCLFAASTSRKNELICQRHSDHCWQGTACNSTYVQALPKMQAQAAKHPLPLGLVKTEGHSWQYTPPLE